MRATDNPFSPDIRCRVLKRPEKRALWMLNSGDWLQVWRHREEPRILQPALVIAEGAALATAQIQASDEFAIRTEMDVDILALCLPGSDQKPSNSSSPVVSPPFTIASGDLSFGFFPLADRTRLGN